MLGGVKLSLLIGPVPVPAPRAVVEALTSVKVEPARASTQSGFELIFELPRARRCARCSCSRGGAQAACR